MIVIGGVYRERCVEARIDAMFGSGGRAAVALASANENVRLETFAAKDQQLAICAALEGAGVELGFAEAAALTEFRYLHSLAKPSISPWPVEVSAVPIVVSDEQVLLFGTLEGTAQVTGGRVVYDPQHSDPLSFL
ncbi:MAG TPA: hypothetical protein VHV27_13335, partial [Phenylobacterium sp.]|nr:hypothetical protein [Phenylobacterium sp.]